MKKPKSETYRIRCKDCGYETERFHGWAFAVSTCRTPNQPGMLHNWKVVHQAQTGQQK